jgi:hypothetical protein
MPDLAAAIRDVPMPQRFKKLPVNDKGFPIPAFVAWLDVEGKRYLPPNTFGALRDFRIIDQRFMTDCFRFSRCWLCGEPLGRHRVFAIGPMCAVNRVTMEPPSHRDCVEYAVRTCPFMVRPKMRRNDKNLGEHLPSPGFGIDRNPGAMCLWETETYHRFRTYAGGDGMLCQLGEPKRVEWYAEGREATRAEVLESIDSGFPLLMELAVKQGPEAIAELHKQRLLIDPWLPKE